MLVDLHSFLRSFELQLPLLESHLNLLLEDLAFIYIMRRGIVPLAVPHVLELIL